MSYLYNQVKAYRDVYGPASSTIATVANSADGLSWYYTFAATGTFTPINSFSATVLVVGGGGGGGGRIGGGGGGGGVVSQSVSFVAGTTYAVTPGLGGTGAYLLSTNGNSSSITYNAGANTLVSSLGGGHGAVFWRGSTISGAIFNGSISGTTLTSGTVITGAIANGHTLYHASIPAGVTITGGSGTSWTVSTSLSATGALTNIYSTLAGHAAAGATAGLVGSGGGGTLGHDNSPGQFQVAGLGTSGQGNAGGAPGNSTTQYGAGGGGGASAGGGAAAGNSGGAGGAGYTAFNGSIYGGGGGGCNESPGAVGAGGSGGGGSGIGTAGSPNTGGGGGGVRNGSDVTSLFGGNGGSGIIIIKVLK